MSGVPPIHPSFSDPIAGLCSPPNPNPSFKINRYLNSTGVRANITTVDFDTNNDLLLEVRVYIEYAFACQLSVRGI